MRGNELLDKMELIDPVYIEEADGETKKRKNVWVKWGAAVACLCLAAGAFALFKGFPEQSHSVLHWSEDLTATEYFAYCDSDPDEASSGNSLDISAIPYDEERDFSDRRQQLEAEKVIPKLDSSPLFDCKVYYNRDGSIFSVNLSWHRRGDTAEYSDLKITAGYREVKQIKDCIAVEVDENGNITEPHITVTERDGVQIVTEGGENREKTVTFQNENGWYQISGSWNDSYEAVIELLDWIWEHPLDLSRFPIDEGNLYQAEELSEYPYAFSEYLPDFAAFGLVQTDAALMLKNGSPVSFEGHYSLASAVRDENEQASEALHWCFDTEPDYYDIQRCIGELSELTEQRVAEELSEEGSVAFMWDGNCVIVYSRYADRACAIIKSLMTK